MPAPRARRDGGLLRARDANVALCVGERNEIQSICPPGFARGEGGGLLGVGEGDEIQSIRFPGFARGEGAGYSASVMFMLLSASVNTMKLSWSIGSFSQLRA